MSDPINPPIPQGNPLYGSVHTYAFIDAIEYVESRAGRITNG